ncbi:MAG: hypothetical protein JSW73_05565 [Candidatus Woesearchaeota archaeon]|nr:MAG: hypothetical protein JSW73_05565 [Candidatus Woesearchaeota archaeon]
MINMKEFDITENGLLVRIFKKVDVDLSKYKTLDVICHIGGEHRKDRFTADGMELIDATNIHKGLSCDNTSEVQAAIKDDRYLLVSKEEYTLKQLNEGEDIGIFTKGDYGAIMYKDRIRFVSLNHGKFTKSKY